MYFPNGLILGKGLVALRDETNNCVNWKKYHSIEIEEMASTLAWKLKFLSLLVPLAQRFSSRLTFDLSYVLLRAPNGVVPSISQTNDAGISCRTVEADELLKLAHDDRFDVNNKTVENMRRTSSIAIGAFSDNELAGLSFYAQGTIAPEHNRGGSAFNGVGLRLPENVCYQFKVFVLPEFRGKQINGKMIEFASELFKKHSVDIFITTTDIVNKPFLSSVRKQGFSIVGFTCEWAMFKKSIYWTSKSVPLASSEADGVKSRIDLFH